MSGLSTSLLHISGFMISFFLIVAQRREKPKNRTDHLTIHPLTVSDQLSHRLQQVVGLMGV